MTKAEKAAEAAQIQEHGTEDLVIATLDTFKAAEAAGITVYTARVIGSNVIDYVKDKMNRQLGIVTCRIGESKAVGITSPTMVDMMLSHPDKLVQLTFRGEKYSDYAKANQPTFDLMLLH